MGCLVANATDPGQYIRHLLPLPKEVQFGELISYAPDAIKVEIVGTDDPVAITAADALRTTLADLTGESPDGGSHRIKLLVVSNDSPADLQPEPLQRLEMLPNADQGYVIKEHGIDGLVVAAFTPQGLWNGVRTLSSLLVVESSAQGVLLPQTEILDWPDMAERGLWNEPAEWTPWLAQMKLNYVDVRSRIQPIERGQPASISIDTGHADEVRLLGLYPVARITHLNFWRRPGLYRAYPEMAGLGDGALAGRYPAHGVGPMHRVPNPLDPMLVSLLADLMRDICQQGIFDIACWLTERPATDGRPETLEVGQFVLEARAFVQAWEKVRTEYPQLQIRLFLSTTTDERHHLILHESPPEVKIVRACRTDGERVPMIPRDRFINPLLDTYGEKGRWLGTYDIPLNANGKVETPHFKLPHRSAHRIRDFVRQYRDRGYQGAAGMMAFHRHGQEICGFNIAALAEWSWNTDGRDEAEFARAWATLQGFDPAQVDALVAWADIMGPVEWDVYDSDFTEKYAESGALEMIRQSRMPVLGENLFRYYDSLEAFDEKLAACDRAMVFARKIPDEDFALSTAVIRSYIALDRALYQVARLHAADDLRNLDAQAKMRDLLEQLEAAAETNAKAIRDWRTGHGPEPWHRRVGNAIQATGDTAAEIVRWIDNRYFY